MQVFLSCHWQNTGQTSIRLWVAQLCLSAHEIAVWSIILPGRSLRRQKRLERLKAKHAEHKAERQRRRELVKVRSQQCNSKPPCNDISSAALWGSCYTVIVWMHLQLFASKLKICRQILPANFIPAACVVWIGAIKVFWNTGSNYVLWRLCCLQAACNRVGALDRETISQQVDLWSYLWLGCAYGLLSQLKHIWNCVLNVTVLIRNSTQRAYGALL